MRKNIIGFLILTAFLVTVSTAFSAEKPKPFGLEVGKSTYTECLEVFNTKNWQFKEYTKKQFKLIEENNPERGKSSFVMVKAKGMNGAKGLRLFFSNRGLLDAMIIILEPHMFPIIMDELDNKHKLINKNLLGEAFSENYTHVLWEKEGVYIELQKLSEHFVRLLYVDKLLYENYKDFLFRPYESFRRRESIPVWINDL